MTPPPASEPATAPSPRPPAPTFAQALRFWLRLGCISFGGPAGQIALMHTELVEGRRWISERRFLHALNYCMLLPGPEAQQLATYIGWLLHGTRGGIAAGALFVLPSLLLLIGLSWLYMVFGQTAAVAGVLWGIKPAVTAIVLAAAWRIGKRALKNRVLWGIAAVALGLWAGAMALLLSLGGLAVGTHTEMAAQGTLVQMGWFFTKAALLTFGGAYAVLPYVAQAAVGHFGWLSAAQMIDGLALGETTPGPLIMVVAFVAFVGCWTQPMFGADHVLAAAVVGVIVNLALFFAQRVLWPAGFGGAFEWASAGIGMVAALALMRFDVGVLKVIGACAALGLARAWVMSGSLDELGRLCASD